MKSSTKDKAQGKMHQVKGAMKEGIGIAVKDKDLEVEGKIETFKGKIQENIGSVEKIMGK